MIIVVGSIHDPVAIELVAAWSNAALCSAQDMTTRGWAWSPTGAVESRWVVGGQVVADRDVTGVFVRRAAFYEAEFTETHRDDRRYLAAEAHALMADVLGSTGAVVASPVADGTFGDEVVRPDRWMRAAVDAGMAIAPTRLRSGGRRPLRTAKVTPIEFVAGGRSGPQTFGNTSLRTANGIETMARLLGLSWATFVLDGRQRIVTVTTANTPSDAAREALARLLGGGPHP